MSTQVQELPKYKDNYRVPQAGQWRSQEEQHQYGCDLIASEGFNDESLDQNEPIDTTLMDAEFFGD